MTNREELVKDLPFSKRKQAGRNVIDVPEYKKMTELEKHLQFQCEEYLRVKKIPYVRIPDQIYNIVVKSKYSNLATEYLKGIPDLIIFNAIPDSEYNQVLCVELKTSKGKPTQGQRNWGKYVNVLIRRSFEHFKKTVDEFIS